MDISLMLGWTQNDVCHYRYSYPFTQAIINIYIVINMRANY